MTVNITFRETQAGATVQPTNSVDKNAPLSNAEIDGNFKAIKDAIDPIQQRVNVSSGSVFYENGSVVSSNYTIGSNKNAMAAGPITVNTGITVTVENGSSLVIV